MADSGTDASVADSGEGPDSGTDAGVVLVAGPALWPLPGTPGHARSYVVGAATVGDSVTGLEWERAVSEGARGQAASVAYCDELTLGGFDDWRLPTLMELLSIVDYGTLFSAIDATAFPDTPGQQFWSSSKRTGTSGAWYVLFSQGVSSHESVVWTYNARCVRTKSVVVAPSTTRFSVGAGVVIDHHTGLEWRQAVHASSFTQSEAVAHCASLGNGYRLPTVLELASIVDETATDPAISTTVFPDTPAEWFWSSTAVAAPDSTGWTVSFDTGEVYYAPLSDPGRARCVR